MSLRTDVTTYLTSSVQKHFGNHKKGHSNVYSGAQVINSNPSSDVFVSSKKQKHK